MIHSTLTWRNTSSCSMFSLAVITLLLVSASEANKLETVPDSSCHQQSTMRNNIIDVNASRAAGAVFISTVRTSLFQTCTDLCCREPGCNLAVYRTDAVSGAQAKIDQGSPCYLFNCQTPSVCKLSEHSLYTVTIIASRPVATQLPEVAAPTSTAASPRKGVAFLSACHRGDTCEGLNTECSRAAGICVCKDGYQHKNGVCRQRCDPTTSYECVNGKADYSGPDCIAVYDVCNGIPECADGSDELGCSEGAAWQVSTSADDRAAAAALAPHASGSSAATPVANGQQSATTRQPAAGEAHGAAAAERKPPGMAASPSPQPLMQSTAQPDAVHASSADSAVTAVRLLGAVQQDAAMTTAAAQRASALAALVLSSLLALALVAFGVRRCAVGSSRAALVHKVKAMGWADKGDADYLVNGMYL